MASVSKLKRMLDELRYKYQNLKTQPHFPDPDNEAYTDLIDEILEDIQRVDSYCHFRNRY